MYRASVGVQRGSGFRTYGYYANNGELDGMKWKPRVSRAYIEMKAWRIYTYIYIYTHIFMCIRIERERERERERESGRTITIQQCRRKRKDHVE